MERTNIFNPAVHTSRAVHFAHAAARFNKYPPRRGRRGDPSSPPAPKKCGVVKTVVSIGSAGAQCERRHRTTARSAGRAAAARRKKYANGGNTKVVRIYAQPFALIARVAPAPGPPPAEVPPPH